QPDDVRLLRQQPPNVFRGHVSLDHIAPDLGRVTRLQMRRQTGVGLDTGELPGRQVLGLGRKTILLDMRDPARAASAGRRLEDLDRLSGRGCAKAECQTGNGHDGSYKGADRHNLLPPASNSIWRPPDDFASRRTVGT